MTSIKILHELINSLEEIIDISIVPEMQTLEERDYHYITIRCNTSVFRVHIMDHQYLPESLYIINVYSKPYYNSCCVYSKRLNVNPDISEIKTHANDISIEIRKHTMSDIIET